MSGEVIARSTAGVGLVPWVAVLAGPMAWILKQGLGYAVMKPVCAHDATGILWLISAAALALAVTGAWLGWGRVRALQAAAKEDGSNPIDRTFFIAIIAVAFDGLLALLIITSAIPEFLLSPCE